MEPEQQHIDQVGQALIDIVSYPYTPEQLTFLTDFLMNVAQSFDEANAKKLFNDKPPVIEAIQNLTQFTATYQKNDDIMNAFKNEMDELLLKLNEPESGIGI